MGCAQLVGRFDHYCDWVRNSIGARNHTYYLGLICAQSANLAVAAWLSLLRLHRGATAGGLWVVLLLFVLCATGLLADIQVRTKDLAGPLLSRTT